MRREGFLRIGSGSHLEPGKFDVRVFSNEVTSASYQGNAQEFGSGVSLLILRSSESAGTVFLICSRRNPLRREPVSMSVSMMSVSLLAALLLGGAVAGCASSGQLAGAAEQPRAVSGGFISGNLGQGLSELDRKQAYDAEVSALETGSPGYPVGWSGESGARGTVIAGPAYRRAGFQNCRDYSHTIYVAGRPQIARGMACRADDGKWKAVS